MQQGVGAVEPGLYSRIARRGEPHCSQMFRDRMIVMMLFLAAGRDA
jgi:hypothetical protein